MVALLASVLLSVSPLVSMQKAGDEGNEVSFLYYFNDPIGSVSIRAGATSLVATDSDGHSFRFFARVLSDSDRELRVEYTAMLNSHTYRWIERMWASDGSLIAVESGLGDLQQLASDLDQIRGTVLEAGLYKAAGLDVKTDAMRISVKERLLCTLGSSLAFVLTPVAAILYGGICLAIADVADPDE